jgi:hypothetical protein
MGEAEKSLRSSSISALVLILKFMKYQDSLFFLLSPIEVVSGSWALIYSLIPVQSEEVHMTNTRYFMPVVPPPPCHGPGRI